jgi:hypothetical protein
MDTVLGLIGLFLYMAGVIGLASAVTYIVVKLSPSKSMKEQQARERPAPAE